MKYMVIFFIRIYQVFISPLLGPTCRFYPSCSHYSETAIRQFGLLKGGWLSIKRIIKCNPFHPGGYDPVPQLPSKDNHG